MSRKYIGASVVRKEDPRLLTGRGRFVDDLELPDMLHMAVCRSPHVHARLLAVHLDAALQSEGVVAAWRYADIASIARPFQMFLPHPALKGKMYHALASEVVRHVGEPVAVVAAHDRYLAEDAVRRIVVDYAPLPAVDSLAQALAPEAPLVYTDAPGNVVAQYDAYAETLTLWATIQAPHRVHRALAALLDLSQPRMRVIAPDVGGGFGPKAQLHPEHVLVALLAMRLRRPVKYTEDRLEHFVTTSQEREQLHRVRVAFNRDGIIVGLQDTMYIDMGAYTPAGVITPWITQTTIPGTYKIPNLSLATTVTFGAASPVGADRPAAATSMI